MKLMKEHGTWYVSDDHRGRLHGSEGGHPGIFSAAGRGESHSDRAAGSRHRRARLPARPVHGTAAGRSATLDECRKEASSWQNAAYRSYGPDETLRDISRNSTRSA